MSYQESEQTERRELHPTSYMVAAIPLPTQDQQSEGIQEAVKVQTVGGMRMLAADPDKIKRIRPGLHAGIVTEVGPLPDDHPREVHAPFDQQGATIYFPEGAEIKVVDYILVPINQILAWEDAPSAR